MQCETTPQEELAVLNWLDEDQANQHEMDRLDEIFNAMVLHAPAPAPRRRSVFTLQECMSLRSLCRSNDRLDCRGRLLVQRLAYQRLQQSDADGMRPRKANEYIPFCRTGRRFGSMAIRRWNIPWPFPDRAVA